MEEVFERFGCGFFDSRCRRDFGQRSPVRTVHGYELELFTEEEGASYIGEVRYVVRRGMLLCAKPGQTRHSELPVRCYYIRLPAGDAAVDRILDRLPDVTYLGDGHDCEEMLEGINRLIRLHCGGEEMGEDERLLCTRAVLYEVLRR